MGQPAAKQGDQVVGVDTHIVVVPGSPAPVPLPHPKSWTTKSRCDRQVHSR